MGRLALLLLFLTFPLSAGPASLEGWIPVVGRARGAEGQAFSTEVVIANPAARQAPVTLSYYPSASPGETPRRLLLEAAPQSALRRELTGDLIDGPVRVGALRVSAPVPVSAAATIRGPGGAATFRAVPAAMAVGVGQTTELQGPGKATRYKLHAVETKGHPLHFSAKMSGADGEPLAVRRFYLSPFEQRSWELTEPFSRLRLEPVNGSGRLIAAGSTVEEGAVIAFPMPLQMPPRQWLSNAEIGAYLLAAAALVLAAARARR